jgi:hypothetical protein
MPNALYDSIPILSGRNRETHMHIADRSTQGQVSTPLAMVGSLDVASDLPTTTKTPPDALFHFPYKFTKGKPPPFNVLCCVISVAICSCCPTLLHRMFGQNLPYRVSHQRTSHRFCAFLGHQ